MQIFLTAVIIIVAIALLWVYIKFLNRRVIDWMLGKKPSSQSPTPDTPENPDMASHYRKKAMVVESVTSKNNLLGLAALWEHDPETAIPYLEHALDGAIGEGNEWTIANNLVIAYLQASRYRDAFRVLEQQRNAGHILLTPYTLCLIGLGQWDKARNFYEQRRMKMNEHEHILVDTIMAYDAKNPETLERVQNLITTPDDWWLFIPVLQELTAIWELDVFFLRTDRYNALTEQGQSILDAIQSDSTIFTDPKLRWLRTVISTVLPRCGTFHGCAHLFGIIFGLDKWMDTLQQAPPWMKDYQEFWKRVTYVFPRTADFLQQDSKVAERQFIRELLPPDSEALLQGIASKCEVYRSPSVGATFRVELVRNQYAEYHYVDWINEDYAAALGSLVNPLVRLAVEHANTIKIIDALIFSLVCYPEELTTTQVNNALWQLNEEDLKKLFSYGFSSDGLSVLQKMNHH